MASRGATGLRTQFGPALLPVLGCTEVQVENLAVGKVVCSEGAEASAGELRRVAGCQSNIVPPADAKSPARLRCREAGLWFRKQI